MHKDKFLSTDLLGIQSKGEILIVWGGLSWNVTK